MGTKRDIVVDLDGPILDGRFRQYECYAKILREHDIGVLSADEFWRLKRAKSPLSDLLSASGAVELEPTFRRLWLDRIEDSRFLDLDRLQDGAIETLSRWSDEGRRVLVSTLRQSGDRAQAQAAALGVDRYCQGVVVSPFSDGGRGKAAAVRAVRPDLVPSETLWIGDTEIDVEAARSIGCGIVAVTCGIRDIALLESLRPDEIVPGLRDVSLSEWDRRCSDDGS